jgi:hypothetical protein
MLFDGIGEGGLQFRANRPCVIFTQLTSPQTAVRAMKIGAVLWLGFVLTTWATENVFEVRAYALFAINTGFWLIGMVTMGAIVGAWKKK